MTVLSVSESEPDDCAVANAATKIKAVASMVVRKACIYIAAILNITIASKRI
jgi:hypothetical protein